MRKPKGPPIGAIAERLILFAIFAYIWLRAFHGG